MAAKSAIEANATDSESQMFMLSLLDKLEAVPHWFPIVRALSNDVVGYAHVENFALGIFTRADDEDRAGKASKKTAKSFLAASTFVEVLKGFGPIDDGVAEKIKYSRFKAIDIIKAI
ncbi:Vta1 like-domain-containing protein [Chytriomyces sp. MP71]|nr:Vta1 like-domain-containing protein [Chytriomyces sp. MP71]